MGKASAKAEPDGTPSSQPLRKVLRKPQRPPTTNTKFEGKVVELKGFIFDCFDADGASRYNDVQDEIAEYAG